MSTTKERQLSLETSVSELFIRKLECGGRVPLSELRQSIPDDLAEKRAALSSPAVYADMGQLAFGRFALGEGAANLLLAKRDYARVKAEGEDCLSFLGEPVAGTDAVAQPASGEKGSLEPEELSNALTRAGSSAELPCHEIAELFPLLEGKPYQELKEDIRVNGQREPITTYQGKIVDGRNRYRACKDLGLEPRTEEWDGNGSLVSLSASKNLHRRQLNQSQRAMVAAKLKPFFEQEGQARMRAGKAADPVASLPQGKSRDLVGARISVSGRSIGSAAKVLKSGAAELVRSVESGKVSVSMAADLAELPQEEQRQALAGGKKVLTAKAREVRTRKRKAAQPNNLPANQQNQPTPGSKAVAGKGDQIVIRKADSPSAIARALFGLLGKERATEVKDALTKLKAGAQAAD